MATAAIQGEGTAGPAYNSFAVALSYGFILIPSIGSIGQISAAYVNPAVTLGLATAGKFLTDRSAKTCIGKANSYSPRS